MNQTHNAYIAIGSNKGDKFKNLQLSLNHINEKAGSIRAISRVYTSEAVGFDGDDFFNACVIVETFLAPQELLKALLDIESDMGRTRSQTKGYESRAIDLDIVLFDNMIVKSQSLQIPHPEMRNRKFVLYPLNDIAAEVVCPETSETITSLMMKCEDKSDLEALNISLKKPLMSCNFSIHNYIAIEGNIGAGKTSLSTMISNDFNAKLVLERFADNPFLPKFYEDAHRYAFTLEMSFLADRYQQISDDLSQLDLFKDFIVSDYDVFKSLIFSKITLQEDEFTLYRKLFYLMYKDIAKPDLYVYLYQNTARLQENIKKRGRDYEQNIEDEYLEKINAGYLVFLKSQTEFNVKIIDVSDRDFVKNRGDYLWVLSQICES